MKRHNLATRLWHWTNLVALVVLFMSGLNISNAHRYLYWGDYGFDPADAWTSVVRFPGWATIPGYYSLAKARDWHTLAAWVFALALLFGWIALLLTRHFQRDVMTSRREWRPANLWRDIVDHAKLKFDNHRGKYNTLQKISYGAVYGVMLPMMIFTGIAISPGAEPYWSWAMDLMGGRQSARSLHFIFAWIIFGFFVVHVLLVLVTGPVKQIRAMITGGRQEDFEHD